MPDTSTSRTSPQINDDDVEEKATLTLNSAVEQIGFGRFQLAMVVLCGCIQAADSMEMLLLSFLGRSVQCQWRIGSQQVALITTFVFVGTIVGSPLLGSMSDRYGRWNTLLFSAVIIAYYGAASAASPSVQWLCGLRAMVGFAIGGLLPLTSTITGEFLPVRVRASFIICMMTFWTFGGLFEVLLAWLTLGTEFHPNAWRVTMAATAVPLFLLLPLFAWMPRSPRFLLAAGRPKEALEQLNRAAEANGRPRLRGRLVAEEVAVRGSARSLFGNRTMTRLTLLLCLQWLTAGFVYYGLILLATELPATPHRCLQDWRRVSSVTERESSDCCRAFGNAEYATAAVATCGEFVGFALMLLLADACGRRALMAGSCCAQFFLILSLQFCVSERTLALLLFLSRSLAIAQFNTAYIYSNEAFPTSVRTLGMGVCCACSRVGALVSPFVAQVLLANVSVMAGLVMYATAAAVGCLAACLLPFETSGRPMAQTVEETHAAATEPEAAKLAERKMKLYGSGADVQSEGTE